MTKMLFILLNISYWKLIVFQNLVPFILIIYILQIPLNQNTDIDQTHDNWPMNNTMQNEQYYTYILYSTCSWILVQKCHLERKLCLYLQLEILKKKKIQKKKNKKKNKTEKKKTSNSNFFQ